MQKDLKQEINQNLNKLALGMKVAQDYYCEKEVLEEVNRALEVLVSDINCMIEKEEHETRDKREDVFQHADNAAWLRLQQL